MTDSLRETLAESLAPAAWEWLRPHAVAGRLVVVSPELDLLDVGSAIALDASAQVKDWLETGQLAVADDAAIAQWDESTPETTALIVQPFVLVTKPGDATA